MLMWLHTIALEFIMTRAHTFPIFVPAHFHCIRTICRGMVPVTCVGCLPVFNALQSCVHTFRKSQTYWVCVQWHTHRRCGDTNECWRLRREWMIHARSRRKRSAFNSLCIAAFLIQTDTSPCLFLLRDFLRWLIVRSTRLDLNVDIPFNWKWHHIENISPKTKTLKCVLSRLRYNLEVAN